MINFLVLPLRLFIKPHSSFMWLKDKIFFSLNFTFLRFKYFPLLIRENSFAQFFVPFFNENIVTWSWINTLCVVNYCFATQLKFDSIWNKLWSLFRRKEKSTGLNENEGKLTTQNVDPIVRRTIHQLLTTLGLYDEKSRDLRRKFEYVDTRCDTYTTRYVLISRGKVYLLKRSMYISPLFICMLLLLLFSRHSLVIFDTRIIHGKRKRREEEKKKPIRIGQSQMNFKRFL